MGLGGQLNAHMKLFYAWRFFSIRQKQAASESGQSLPRDERIADDEKSFARDRAQLDQDKQAAARELAAANRAEAASTDALSAAQMRQARFGLPVEPQLVMRNEAAKRVAEQKQVTFERLRARRDTAADDSALSPSIDHCGQMLFNDARQIVGWMRADQALRLRPHYAALVEAYLDEFERGRGLHAGRDAKLIELFEHYVHDSLAGFAKDETWPSDPRIVYVGSDNKLRYAFQPAGESGLGATQAA